MVVHVGEKCAEIAGLKSKAAVATIARRCKVYELGASSPKCDYRSAFGNRVYRSRSVGSLSSYNTFLRFVKATRNTRLGSLLVNLTQSSKLGFAENRIRIGAPFAERPSLLVGALTLH